MIICHQFCFIKADLAVVVHEIIVAIDGDDPCYEHVVGFELQDLLHLTGQGNGRFLDRICILKALRFDGGKAAGCEFILIGTRDNAAAVTGLT